MSALYIGLMGFLVSCFAYENIALDKPTHQDFPYGTNKIITEELIQASNAVDGLKSNLSVWSGQCVISANQKQTATWWVNLRSILSIHHITIYYRTENVAWKSSGSAGRFLGFSLYVSNTTDLSKATLCFKDNEYTVDTIPHTFNKTCPYHGQFVIYHNDRSSDAPRRDGFSQYAYNELCEVEVYGCPTTRHYGPNCSISCPENCLSYCHIETGTCLGCKPGYQGDRCESECTDGFYGDGCQKECGKCADMTQCNHVNGNCLGDCQSGFKGENCSQECDDGTYGKHCYEICGNCLDNSQCSHINGTCLTGCVAGYKGNLCKTECDDGTYGRQCSETCGHCFDITKCSHINGTCTTGCAAGYHGELCNYTCPDGFFGLNCLNKCKSTCRGCNKVSGLCDTGCLPGWKEDYCQHRCDNNMFGQNCSKTCGKCLGLKQCDHINGTCMDGCNRGFQGELCYEECNENYFGFNCEEMCNGTCKGCNSVTGVCETGCQAGWRGSYCHEECSTMFYGEDCNSKCGHCFDKETCHHINGTCFKGCSAGYQGYLCNNECDDGKYGLQCEEYCGNCSDTAQCSHVNGTCLTGCNAGYEGHLCNVIASKQTTSPDSAELPIVGAVVGVLLAAVVILVVVFLIRRRRTNTPGDKYITSNETLVKTDDQYSNVSKITKPSKKKADNQNSKILSPPSDTEENEKTQETEDKDNVYMNETPTRYIPVEQLTAVIAEKRAKGDEGFRKEYAALPSGETHTCEAGKKPENIPKNRFKTTFPYDHSRVILRTTSEEASDYINANYINGTNRSKEYIAAQGPRQNTLNDFWKMIWQEEVSSIVMLTNLKEGDKIKCTQYWPNKNESPTFGPVSIKMIEEKKYAAFIERKLSLNNKALNKTRKLTQYHYISWPDHGTPEPLSLLDFHHHVTSTANQNKVPTVVHCSAGVGRTGTYIALDALYQEGKKTGRVNVAEFVRKMRDNRMTMVQTYEQYITISLALNEIFKAPIQKHSGADFCTKTEKALRDSPANQNPLRKEFQLLLKIKPVYTEADYKVAKQMSAGRQTYKILPLDKYSLHLSSAVPKRGNYINAITVPSFTEATRFIVTRYPSPEDAVDFLRLLNDHESDTVICLDPVHEVESIQSWLPLLSSSTVVAPFTIHCQSNSRNGVSGHVIDILQDNQEDEAHSVLVIGPSKGINPCGNPRNTSELLQLVSNVLSLETDTPITVVSSDGGSLCGLFIAVHNAIQQLNTDGGLDVFTVVRQLQIRRPELCSSIEEYEMVHRTVYDHIQTASENIYCNQ
uniref:protein-tyrosine-phosphatase n=1 Tax=Crassostrea virginica TaxID=6565 RepID=A0A8B8BRU1_CRAVI|nr:receptor-type tyrosine-protein phosphatase alpha-like isoform X2 [Crassostrea virginica]